MSVLYRNFDGRNNQYIHIILSTQEAQEALKALPDDLPDLAQRSQDIAAMTVPLNPDLARWIMGPVDDSIPMFDVDLEDAAYAQTRRFVSGEITLEERDALVASLYTDVAA